MGIQIRPASSERDFEGIAAILSHAENEVISAAELIENSQRALSAQRICHEIVAETNNVIVGYGTVFTTNTMESGRSLVKVWTHSEHRSKGIGAQLYEAVVAFAVSKGMRTLETNLFDNEAHSLRFAEARRFKIERHLFESEIELERFDATRFDTVIESVQNSGIRLFTLADAGHTRENLYKLWDVNYKTYLDDPATTGIFPDFEAFYTMVSDAPWFVAETQFLAADGDEYIGLAAMSYQRENNSFYNMMTGVRREYRGRQIALALKLMAIAYARQHGGKSIRTNNDSQNAPMLAINRRLGYMPLPGVYRMVKAEASSPIS